MNNQSKDVSVIKDGVIDYYYIFDYIDTKKIIKRINLLKKLSKSELAIGHAIKNKKTGEIKVDFKEHFFKNTKKDSDSNFLEESQLRAMNRFQQTVESEIIYTSNLAYNYKNVYLLYPIKVVLENGINRSY